MADYNSYFLATLLPSIVIICTVLILTYCFWGLSYLVFVNQRRKAERRAINELLEYPGLQYIFMTLQPILGSSLKARRARNRVKILLHGEEILQGGIPFVLQMVMTILSLSLAIFVTALTVETSSVCNERLDCFPFNYSKQVTPLSTNPIVNCSRYDDSHFSVVCYQFSIRFTEALARGGGVLALTAIGINYYIAIMFATARTRCCRTTGLWGCVFVTLTGMIVLLGTLLWALPFILAHADTLKYIQNWESFLVYYYTIMYLLLVATILPCCAPRYRHDFGAHWSHLRRDYISPDHESVRGREGEEEEEDGEVSHTRQTSLSGRHASVDSHSSTGQASEISTVIVDQEMHSPSTTEESSSTVIPNVSDEREGGVASLSGHFRSKGGVHKSSSAKASRHEGREGEREPSEHTPLAPHPTKLKSTYL